MTMRSECSKEAIVSVQNKRSEFMSHLGPDVLVGSLTHSRELELDDLCGPSNPGHSVIDYFQKYKI